jgi:hypothetical protein
MSINFSVILFSRPINEYKELSSGGSEIPTTGIFKYSSRSVNQVPLNPVWPVTNIGPGSPRSTSPTLEFMSKLYPQENSLWTAIT